MDFFMTTEPYIPNIAIGDENNGGEREEPEYEQQQSSQEKNAATDIIDESLDLAQQMSSTAFGDKGHGQDSESEKENGQERWEADDEDYEQSENDGEESDEEYEQSDEEEEDEDNSEDENYSPSPAPSGRTKKSKTKTRSKGVKANSNFALPDVSVTPADLAKTHSITYRDRRGGVWRFVRAAPITPKMEEEIRMKHSVYAYVGKKPSNLRCTRYPKTRCQYKMLLQRPGDGRPGEEQEQLNWLRGQHNIPEGMALLWERNEHNHGRVEQPRGTENSKSRLNLAWHVNPNWRCIGRDWTLQKLKHHTQGMRLRDRKPRLRYFCLFTAVDGHKCEFRILAMKNPAEQDQYTVYEAGKHDHGMGVDEDDEEDEEEGVEAGMEEPNVGQENEEGVGARMEEGNIGQENEEGIGARVEKGNIGQENEEGVGARMEEGNIGQENANVGAGNEEDLRDHLSQSPIEPDECTINTPNQMINMVFEESDDGHEMENEEEDNQKGIQNTEVSCCSQVSNAQLDVDTQTAQIEDESERENGNGVKKKWKKIGCWSKIELYREVDKRGMDLYGKRGAQHYYYKCKMDPQGCEYRMRATRVDNGRYDTYKVHEVGQHNSHPHQEREFAHSKSLEELGRRMRKEEALLKPHALDNSKNFWMIIGESWSYDEVYARAEEHGAILYHWSGVVRMCFECRKTDPRGKPCNFRLRAKKNKEEEEDENGSMDCQENMTVEDNDQTQRTYTVSESIEWHNHDIESEFLLELQKLRRRSNQLQKIRLSEWDFLGTVETFEHFEKLRYEHGVLPLRVDFNTFMHASLYCSRYEARCPHKLLFYREFDDAPIKVYERGHHIHEQPAMVKYHRSLRERQRNLDSLTRIDLMEDGREEIVINEDNDDGRGEDEENWPRRKEGGTSSRLEGINKKRPNILRKRQINRKSLVRFDFEDDLMDEEIVIADKDDEARDEANRPRKERIIVIDEDEDNDEGEDEENRPRKEGTGNMKKRIMLPNILQKRRQSLKDVIQIDSDTDMEANECENGEEADNDVTIINHQEEMDNSSNTLSMTNRTINDGEGSSINGDEMTGLAKHMLQNWFHNACVTYYRQLLWSGIATNVHQTLGSCQNFNEPNRELSSQQGPQMSMEAQRPSLDMEANEHQMTSATGILQTMGGDGRTIQQQQQCTEALICGTSGEIMNGEIGKQGQQMNDHARRPYLVMNRKAREEHGRQCLNLEGNNNRTKGRTSIKTKKQLLALKNYFNKNQYPNANDLEQLIQETGLNQRQLKSWFKNSRATYFRQHFRSRMAADVHQQTTSAGMVPKMGYDGKNMHQGTNSPICEETSGENVTLIPSVTGSEEAVKQKRPPLDQVKKPMNAFWIFLTQNRRRYTEKSLENYKDSGEQNRELGRQWREMDMEARRPYLELEWKAREEYYAQQYSHLVNKNYRIQSKAMAHKRTIKKRKRKRFGGRALFVQTRSARKRELEEKLVSKGEGKRKGAYLESSSDEGEEAAEDGLIREKEIDRLMRRGELNLDRMMAGLILTENEEQVQQDDDEHDGRDDGGEEVEKEVNEQGEVEDEGGGINVVESDVENEIGEEVGEENEEEDEAEKSQKIRANKPKRPRGGVNSLIYQCNTFLARMEEDSGKGRRNFLNIKNVAKKLGMDKRRVYNMVEVMEGLGMISKVDKSNYRWNGLAHLPKSLSVLQKNAQQYDLSRHVAQMTRRMCTLGKSSITNIVPNLGPAVDGLSEMAGLCRHFLMILLCTKNRRVSLDVASILLRKTTGNRRLYDIVNALIGMQLVVKRQTMFGSKKITMIQYCGPEPNENDATEQVQLSHHTDELPNGTADNSRDIDFGSVIVEESSSYSASTRAYGNGRELIVRHRDEEEEGNEENMERICLDTLSDQRTNQHDDEELEILYSDQLNFGEDEEAKGDDELLIGGEEIVDGGNDEEDDEELLMPLGEEEDRKEDVEEMLKMAGMGTSPQIEVAEVDDDDEQQVIGEGASCSMLMKEEGGEEETAYIGGDIVDDEFDRPDDRSMMETATESRGKGTKRKNTSMGKGRGRPAKQRRIDEELLQREDDAMRPKRMFTTKSSRGRRRPPKAKKPVEEEPRPRGRPRKERDQSGNENDGEERRRMEFRNDDDDAETDGEAAADGHHSPAQSTHENHTPNLKIAKNSNRTAPPGKAIRMDASIGFDHPPPSPPPTTSTSSSISVTVPFCSSPSFHSTESFILQQLGFHPLSIQPPVFTLSDPITMETLRIIATVRGLELVEKSESILFLPAKGSSHHAQGLVLALSNRSDHIRIDEFRGGSLLNEAAERWPRNTEARALFLQHLAKKVAQIFA